MAAGACRHCGYQPVAYDAVICPKCAGNNPNASLGTKAKGVGAVVGALLGLGIDLMLGQFGATILLFLGGAIVGAVLGKVLGVLRQ